MTYWMRALLGLEGAYYAVAGEGGGDQGGSTGAGGGAGDAPGNAGGSGAGEQAGSGVVAGDGAAGGGVDGAKDGDKPNGGAGDGQAAPEYVDDPAKTPEENAAAKTAHDEKVALDKERAAFYGAPEKYADLVVPEGMQLDQDAANGLHELGKKLDWSQQTVDAMIELQKGVYERQAAAQATEWTDTVKAWTNEIKADPAIGGAKYDANMGLAAQARNTFGSKEFNAWLDETQLGSQPEMARFLVAVGAAMGEAKTIDGGKVDTSVNLGDLLYDHPSSQVTK